MKYNIILCGVGGQGILLLSSLLSSAAKEKGLYVKQSEVHGMAQRGGAVSAQLRISDSEIHSPLIPKGEADLLVSMEPLEVFRYVEYLNDKTVVLVNEEPFVNISNYPDIETVYKDLDTLKAIRLSNADNIMLAGAASCFIDIEEEVYEKVLTDFFKKKGQEILEKRIADFKSGRSKGERK
ncbi:MAG: indolepyruvate oxidoreductase subunit beta [Alphaproteobacteria bacterium]|nr:indolepyruvate oxidoreductase subunit beta [Alphaproteobacteria bacterium]MCL2504705.1 indolepyruvate oxidoreductase subunit beta [Alphaproteobacteria bacterium]